MSAFAEGRVRAENPRTPPGPMQGLLRQLRWDLLQQVRNPAAVFFTLALPLLFLIAFSVTSKDAGSAAEYYVPATMGLAVASGTLTNLAVTLTYLREYGQLKRLLVTPLPRSAYLGSRVVASGIVSLLTCVVLGVVGRLVYGVSLEQPAALALAMLLILAVGSALGVFATVVMRSESAAAPIANAIGLPLMLASGVFFPLTSTPAWFAQLADYLPFTRAVSLATAAYENEATAATMLGAVVTSGAWAVAAGALAVRFFAWAPRKRR